MVPILLEALAALAKERPTEPIDYLVAYLQKHKHQHSAAAAAAQPQQPLGAANAAAASQAGNNPTPSG